ncbi:MAG: DUF6263 family protein [Cytophagales bacterium]|nr:DUF6263 family protein [Cytophagales bacterium]
MKKTTSYFAALLLFISAIQAQQKLQLNLKAGESYKQVTFNDASITQEIMGQSMEINLAVNSSMIFKVVNANRDDYDMEVSFESMKLSMGSMQATMEFDSENPEEGDAFSQIMSGVIGKSFNIKMSKSGKVLELSGIEAMWEAAFSDQNISAAEKAQIMTQLNQTYGSEAVKGNIEMVSAIFPEQKVSKGDQWTNEVNINSGMKGIAETTYTYEGKQGDQYQITGSGTIVTSEEGATINTNGMELTMDLKGTMESAISVDAGTGWIVQATINQKIDGAANMAGNAQMPNGLSIPMKIRNEMSITN